MLLNTRNTVQEKLFPSLAKEGWTRPQENVAKPPYWERTGWFVQTTDNRWLERTTPSRRANVASRNLLDRAATPPYPRRGIADHSISMLSTSEQETYTFARQLAESLKTPAHILLHGDLGAGKTVFAKG